VLDVLVNSAGVDKLVAQAIAVVVVTPLNFVGNKLWSFRRATP
jgi:putative flippase GtrA